MDTHLQALQGLGMPGHKDSTRKIPTYILATKPNFGYTEEDGWLDAFHSAHDRVWYLFTITFHIPDFLWLAEAQIWPCRPFTNYFSFVVASRLPW